MSNKNGFIYLLKDGVAVILKECLPMSNKNDDYDYLFKVEYKMKPPILRTFELEISRNIRDGHYKSAEILCRQVLGDLAKVKNRDAIINAAIVFNILAFIYKNQNEYDYSIDYLLVALDLYRKVLGENNLHVADIYNNLSVIYQKSGMYKEAKCTCLKAAEIMKRVLGPSHPDVQEQLDKFSIFYEKMGQCEKAGFEHAVNIHKKVGPVWQSTARKLKVD